MLTDKPGIGTARPPRRIRGKPKAQPAAVARPPVIAGPRRPEPADPEKVRRRADAADRVWQELVRRVRSVRR